MGKLPDLNAATFPGESKLGVGLALAVQDVATSCPSLNRVFPRRIRHVHFFSFSFVTSTSWNPPSTLT